MCKQLTPSRTLFDLILLAVHKMDAIKNRLLKEHYPEIPRSEVQCGYHRGRRPLVGDVFYPDIISIHHLHLHVIVKPKPLLKLFKYPSWLPLMWKSDKTVLRDLEEKSRGEKVPVESLSLMCNSGRDESPSRSGSSELSLPRVQDWTGKHRRVDSRHLL